jgi:T5SS/PEP-CTERM-associated repeat protein
MLSRKFIIVVVAYSFLGSWQAYAVTTSWNTNSSGNFNAASNWDNGVPDSDDTAVFNRGFLAYEVNFPGGSIFEPPPNYVIDFLRVRTNEVSFVYNPPPFNEALPMMTVGNPGNSIVVGELPGDVAILNMAISRLSGTNASIGGFPGAVGTLNVGEAFNLSGALNIGQFGTGTMNVTGGGTVASTDGFIGVNPGSSGQITVSGANSTWANSNSLTVGGGSNANGRLDVNDGGVVSVMGVLQVGNSGRLAGNGRIQGNVQNLGWIAPGISSPTSVGTLHIDGNYAQGGEMFVELAAADSFDKLDIDGNITLGGRLNVSLLGGYSPQEGATFDILDWTGTQNGRFFNVQLPPLSGRVKWNTSQLYTNGVLSVVPGYFEAGEFITHSQDSWGATPTPGNAAQLLAEGFDIIYGGGVEVGISGNAGYSMIFTSAANVLDYLPASGGPGPLNADLLDPTSTASGIFGGYVLALQLNVDFNDAGDLTGASSTRFGDLVLHDMIIDFGGFSVDMTAFNGLTLRQFLTNMNVRLGGGAGPYTYDDVAVLTDEVLRSFEGGVPTGFAQDHLRFPGDFNLDRAVNAADYVVWRKTDGTPAGYNEWRANFGQPAPGAGGISTVPEPATLLSFAIGGLAWVNSGCGRLFRAGRGQMLRDPQITVTPPGKIDP